MYVPNNESEAHELIMEQGTESLRMIKPLVTKGECLRCHESQGYKEGDIRGGVSITIPMSPFREYQHQAVKRIVVTFIFIWCIGIIILFLFINHLHTIIKNKVTIKNITEKHELLAKHHQELKESNI